MGTVASIICSNPEKLTASFVKDIANKYIEKDYGINVQNQGDNLEIGALYTISEERFLEILSMLKEKYNIEIIEKTWWEFKKFEPKILE